VSTNIWAPNILVVYLKREFGVEFYSRPKKGLIGNNFVTTYPICLEFHLFIFWFTNTITCSCRQLEIPSRQG